MLTNRKKYKETIPCHRDKFPAIATITASVTKPNCQAMVLCLLLNFPLYSLKLQITTAVTNEKKDTSQSVNLMQLAHVQSKMKYRQKICTVISFIISYNMNCLRNKIIDIEY